jgi:uncharacterized protein
MCFLKKGQTFLSFSRSGDLDLNFSSGMALTRTISRPVLEICAVLLTALGKFLFMDILNWRLPFILCVSMFWLGYVFISLSKNPEFRKTWGFRTDNIIPALKLLFPFAVIAIVAFFVIGYYQNTIHLSWHIFPMLLLYPIWGTIQQYLVIALVAGNLHNMENRLGTFMIIFLTALLFGLIHFPSWWLMLATFILALLYGYVFLKERNVLVLGIFHGWLGALFFYTVVNRDPFVEVFGKYF